MYGARLVVREQHCLNTRASRKLTREAWLLSNLWDGTVKLESLILKFKSTHPHVGLVLRNPLLAARETSQFTQELVQSLVQVGVPDSPVREAKLPRLTIAAGKEVVRINSPNLDFENTYLRLV